MKVVEEENVPETSDVQKTMKIHDRAGRRAAVVPDLVRLFRPAHAEGGQANIPTCASPIAAACGPRASIRKNVGSYFGYIDECQYSQRRGCGHSTSKSKKIGFIAAKPIPQVLRNINAFTLGARASTPRSPAS